MNGRPVLGAIAGFFLGLFVWVDLILFGVLPLEGSLGYFLPILGVVGGLAMAKWAPLGSRAPGRGRRAVTEGSSTE